MPMHRGPRWSRRSEGRGVRVRTAPRLWDSKVQAMLRTNLPVGWGLVGCSGWAGTTPGPALLAAEGARLVAILSRDPRRARQALRWMCGWDLAQRLGGPWLVNKLRFSRLGTRLD